VSDEGRGAVVKYRVTIKWQPPEEGARYVWLVERIRENHPPAWVARGEARTVWGARRAARRDARRHARGKLTRGQARGARAARRRRFEYEVRARANGGR